MTNTPSKFAKHIGDLAKLESFSPQAFDSDDAWPQNVCDFILTLALIYNDFRDIVFAHTLLNSVWPKDFDRPTPLLGEISGFHAHLTRLLAGLFRELLLVVKKNSDATTSSQFTSLVSRLQGRARIAWENVLGAAGKNPTDNAQTRLLIFARNNVGFHYSPKALRQGWQSFLLTGREPYISRSAAMATTRFYFADAAADSYLRNIGDAAVTEEFVTASSPLLVDINWALHEIVIQYLSGRVGFREVAAAT